MTDVELSDFLARLERSPDVEGPNLYAVDGVDRLLLAEASGQFDGQLVVVGDSYGALTLGFAHGGVSGIRVSQDSLVGERALKFNAERLGLTGAFRQEKFGDQLFEDASLVVVRLPKALAELAEICEAIARVAPANVQVLVGGRDKSMSHNVGSVLAESFGEVTRSRGRFKSHAYSGMNPKPRLARFPVHFAVSELDLTVVAHGGVFAGPKLDLGTRVLLQVLKDLPNDGTAVDLGCGTGILAAQLKRKAPGMRVVGVDVSARAVESTRLTAQVNGLEVEALQDNILESFADNSVELIVCNPPFHQGVGMQTDIAKRMFVEAARVLSPGGQLWVVFNAHLGYRAQLNQIVGDTEQVGRDHKFIVTRTVKS